MNVVVPHAPGAPFLGAIVLALRAEGIEPRLEPMEDDHAYWRLLRALWREARAFAVVEHDVVAWPGALRDLWDCPRPWCAHPYAMAPGFLAPGLGCTRFSAELLRATPDALDRVAAAGGPDDARHWWALDSRLARVLRELVGLHGPHVHHPPVAHLNPARIR